MNLSPPENEPLKYPLKLHLKVFIFTDQNLLSKNFQFVLGFLFSKPVKVTLGTSVRKISFTKIRPNTKQRPKILKQKCYCSTSRKVLHAAPWWVIISWRVIIRGVIIIGGQLSKGQLSGDQLSRGQLSRNILISFIVIKKMYEPLKLSTLKELNFAGTKFHGN